MVHMVNSLKFYKQVIIRIPAVSTTVQNTCGKVKMEYLVQMMDDHWYKPSINNGLNLDLIAGSNVW